LAESKKFPLLQEVQASGYEALFGWKTHDSQFEGHAAHIPASFAYPFSQVEHYV